MRNPSTLFAWWFAACLALAGCGDGGTKPSTNDPGPEQASAPPPGEVVVEPSKTTLPGEDEPALTVLRELLAGEALNALDGYTIEIDGSFEQKSRLRFVVTADGDEADEAVKQTAADVYAALESAFHTRSEQALRTELVEAVERADAARKRVGELQQTINTYLKSRQGLPATDESRRQRRVYRIMMDSALESQIEKDDAVTKIKRRVDRGDYTKLSRIR